MYHYKFFEIIIFQIFYNLRSATAYSYYNIIILIFLILYSKNVFPIQCQWIFKSV